jgi:hypothetical protein
MPQEAPIEIARNKRNLAYFLAGGLIVLAFGLFVVLDPVPFKPHLLPTTFVIVAAGAAIMVAAGIYSYIMAVRISSVFPGLIVSDKDIYDHTGSPGDGLIPWEDVSEIRESAIQGKRYLTIIVKNPRTYIERQKNPVKRQNLVRLQENYGSPVQILGADLDFDFDSLKTLLQESLERYKGSDPLQ